jgi:hypothetical protein
MRNVPRAPSKPAARPAKPAAAGDLASWALAQLDALEQASPSPRAPPVHALLDRIAQRFGLDEVEHAMLAFLAAAESTIAVSRRLRALSGAPIVSVEAVREVLTQRGFVGVVERLAPRGRLRAHALVRVGDGETRLPAAADALRIEVGFAPTMPLGAELTGLSVLAPSVGERAPFARRLDAKIATVVVLELSGSSSEAAVAQLIADGSSRRVVWWQAHADERDQALRLRRDVDLEGAVLVVSGPAPIGALLAPPPIAPAAPPLVVFLGGELTEREVSASWVLRRDRVATESARSAPPLTEMDRVRLLAQRDADLALGISRPVPAERPVVSGRIIDASVRVAEVPEPVTPAIPAPPEVVAPIPVVTIEPPAVMAAPAPVAPAPTVSVATAPAALSSPIDEGPRLDVSLDAPPDHRARAAMQSQSPTQRIELLRSLAGMKTSTVVAALRHNAKSEHVGLREVAETLMAQLFGAAWNRNRPIAPPTQAPPSDDGGRGPGGAM